MLLAALLWPTHPMWHLAQPTEYWRAALAALLGLVLAGAAHAVPQCELAGEAVNPANGFTTAGKSGLMRCTDADGPVRLREQTLQDGRLDGPARWVYRDGSRKEHSTNAGGNRHGLAREWDARGTLRREENLDDGQPVGLLKTFAEAGHLQFTLLQRVHQGAGFFCSAQTMVPAGGTIFASFVFDGHDRTSSTSTPAVAGCATYFSSVDRLSVTNLSAPSIATTRRGLRNGSVSSSDRTFDHCASSPRIAVHANAGSASPKSSG